MIRKTAATSLGGAASAQGIPPTASLVAAGAAIQQAGSATAIAQAVADAASDICGAAGAVWWDCPDGRFVAAAVSGPRPGVRPSQHADSFPDPDAGSTPAVEVSRKDSAHLPFLQSVGAERALLVPVRDASRRWGVVSVHDGIFDQPQTDLLVALAQHAAAAMRSLDTEAASQRVTREQRRAMDHLGAVLTSALNFDELLATICRQAAGSVGAEACLLLLAEDDGPLRLSAQLGADAADHALLKHLSRLAESVRRGGEEESLWRRTDRSAAPVSRALEASRFHTVLGLVLPIRGEPLGVLLLLSGRPDAFPPDQMGTIVAFARQAAVAIENLQLFESTQRRLLEVADLNWVSSRISALRDVPSIAALSVESAAKALDASRAVILLARPDGEFELAPGGAYGARRDQRTSLPPTGHLGAEVLALNSWLAVADAEAEGQSEDPLLQWLGARSAICVPMSAKQGLRGLFIVGDDRPRTYHSHTAGLLANYAGQAALALQSAILYDNVVRHLNQLSRLFDVSRSLASSLELNEILETVLSSASELLDAPVCSVMLLDANTGELVIKAARGFAPDDVFYESIPPGQGLAGRAAQSGAVLTSTDVSRDGRFYFRQRAREDGLRAAIAAPLIARGRTVGVLSLYRATPDPFTEDDKLLLASLANSAAVAIENAHLYQEAQERADFLSAMMGEINHRIRNTLQAIAGLLRIELERPNVSAEAAIMRGMARIQSVAVVHELMGAREFRFVDMKQVAQRVSQLTRQSLGDDVSCEVIISGARVMLPSQRATSVALVLAELVDNSLRHGFATVPNGRVSISLAEAGGDVIIQVRDNGVGLPDGFDVQAGAGLGLRIAQGLIEQELGGKLEVEADRGVLVRARFPKV